MKLALEKVTGCREDVDEWQVGHPQAGHLNVRRQPDNSWEAAGSELREASRSHVWDSLCESYAFS